MENETENPYKAPEASLGMDNSNNLSEVFDRFSAWGVLGLTLVTLGFYGAYWLYSRTTRINAVCSNPISSAYVTTTLVLYLSSFISPVITFLAPEAVTLVLILSLASTIGSIMVIVWVFKLRNRIHQYSGRENGDSAWAGPIMTFFFNILYLQYKINQTIDEEE